MTNMFSPGQRYQTYHVEARIGAEGPKNLQPLLARWHFVQHHSCCIQGEFSTRAGCALVNVNVNPYYVGQAGRLTNETREIRGLEEKKLGEENARISQLRALHT
jgi:hypothetical protein